MAAHEDVLYITENGYETFGHCSEDETRYAERMARTIREGRADYAAGHTHSFNEAFVLIEARRRMRAASL